MRKRGDDTLGTIGRMTYQAVRDTRCETLETTSPQVRLESLGLGGPDNGRQQYRIAENEGGTATQRHG